MRATDILKSVQKLTSGLKIASFGTCAIWLICISIFSLSLIINSCASIQSPTGGPRDSIPPKVVSENPPNLTRNFKADEITIEFDEFVKLSNEFTEVSFSPAIEILPSLRVKREVLEIKFDEPLEENTTYTINFGKAIADINESNQLTNYTYVFSTGDEIDSLSISGNVINALSKENVLDATVFILPTSQDTLFGKKRASIFTSTDSSGNFKLQNLREDSYRIYALKEKSADRIYNSSDEEIAFLIDSIYLNKDTGGIKLELFKAQATNFTIQDRKIEPDGRISLAFNRGLEDAEINIIDNPDLNAAKTIEISLTRDSALIWLPDLTFDSLKVGITSPTLGDTITLRRTKKDTYDRAVSVIDNLVGNILRPGADLVLQFSAPMNTYSGTGLTIKEDSLAITNFRVEKDTVSKRRFKIKYPWKINKSYTLNLAESAFSDKFGNKSKVFTRTFKLDAPDNYGSITIKVTVPDTSKSYVVQWLGERDELLRSDAISKNTVLNYNSYPTAKYQIRIIYDENNNGKWDPGNLLNKTQPERAWTFEKIISLRPNWDLEENVVIPADSP